MADIGGADAHSDPVTDAPMPPAIPAATLVLFRDRGGAAPELLMVERAATMTFAGGAMVFPGGRIDGGDEALAAEIAPDLADAPARIAAIRETLEETGIAVTIDPSPDAGAAAAMKHALLAGAAIGSVLHEQRLLLDLLVPFARWRPAHLHARIFDTMFFLAQAPPEAPDPIVEASENIAWRWASAAAVLAAADDGEISIIYPTRRNLERLARFGSFADAVADAAAHPVRTITPFAEDRDGVSHLCIPVDAGYPVTSEPITGALRG